MGAPGRHRETFLGLRGAFHGLTALKVNHHLDWVDATGTYETQLRWHMQKLDLPLAAVDLVERLETFEVRENGGMITIHLRYVIDPYKIDDFEEYGRRWIPLVNRFGGTHHGYFLPSEGASNIAYAMFSFPSLAEYEQYRLAARDDAECREVMDHAERTRCIHSFERTFLRPVLG